MKNLLSAAVLAALITTQATALSCIRPDVANAFAEASASDRSYVVVKGTFAFTPPAETADPEAHTIDATFSGRLLTSAGFTQQVKAPVEIDLVCSGSWCAKFEPATDYIAFIENIDNEKLVFEVDPCYGFAFKDPSEDDIKRLENCAQGGKCEPS